MRSARPFLSARTIAQHHFAAALEQAQAKGQDPEAVGRAMLAAENIDRGTDDMFMRP